MATSDRLAAPVASRPHAAPPAEPGCAGAATADACRVNGVLDWLLRLEQAPDHLREAMRYAVLGGGKRTRPRLVYATGQLAGAPLAALDAPAAAVELLHAYSLVHDDLPAMDDDALRRGQPTVHARYGEATAILVGDALQALAFEALAAGQSDAATVRRQVALLARAGGAHGMVAGQSLDMAGEGQRLALAEVERLHRLKTGALIHAAVMLGAAAGALPCREAAALDAFGREIGLAFQIHDDVLDATGRTEVLGKPHGADARRGKATYPRLLGVAAARQSATERLNTALASLAIFDERAHELAALARQMTARES